MPVVHRDDGHGRIIRVLVVYPPHPPAPTQPGTVDATIDRVLMLCDDCKRYHYASVNDCPPADAPSRPLQKYVNCRIPHDCEYVEVIESAY